MKRRGVVLVCGALMLAALVVGCGGGGSSSSTSGTSSGEESSSSSLTKAEFVKQGNALCAAGNKEIGKQFEAFAKEHKLSANHPPSEAESKEAAETILLPTINNEVEEIRALGPPDEEAEELLDTVEEAIEKGEEDPVGLIEEEGDNPFAEANKMAREYGLTACGEEEGGEEEGA